MSSPSSPSRTMRDRLIQQLGLLPHPEGGFYRETYRAAAQVIRQSDAVVRVASTAIYYLLSDDAFSAWHRIRSDELWHFYAGDALDVHSIGSLSHADKQPQPPLSARHSSSLDHAALDAHESSAHDGLGLVTRRLGNALNDEHAVFQAVVASGEWFAAERVPGPHGFTLVGCTVAPGFEFSEFELADATCVDAMEDAHPMHRALIRRLSTHRR